VLAEQLRNAGVSIPESEVMRRFVGKTRGQCLALAAEIRGRELPQRFGVDWDAALFEALRKEVKPMPGVPDVLRALVIPYCAASNGMPDRIRLTLEAAGLLTWFEGRVFTSADVARPKPAPDLFLHAAKSMKVAPSDCVVVEDTVTGVRAARAAGMRVFGYTGSATSAAAALQAEGAIVFDDMRTLPGLLDAHHQGSNVQ
jgi:HAD superfamily hydrolase (TIGR01509 family)